MGWHRKIHRGELNFKISERQFFIYYWHRSFNFLSIWPNSISGRPFNYQTKLLSVFHDTSIGAHLGRSKTYSRMKTRLWWSNMVDYVQSYINSCLKCKVKNHTSLNHMVKFNFFLPATLFNIYTLISQESSKNSLCNHYILIQICMFTRWSELSYILSQRIIDILMSVTFEQYHWHFFRCRWHFIM